MTIISIEGNIGSGKSTVLRNLRETLGGCDSIVFTEEPVDTDTTWSFLMRQFYMDPKKWALLFSTYILTGHRKTWLASRKKKKLVVTERSPKSTRDVFNKLLYDEGKMDLQDCMIYNRIDSILGWVADLTVYIKTPANICLERCQERNREGEEGVGIEYLRRLEARYGAVFNENDCDAGNVVVIDGSASAETVCEKVLDAIMLFRT
jgi:deoxyadenosine/deoxycytidine kinase